MQHRSSLDPTSNYLQNMWYSDQPNAIFTIPAITFHERGPTIPIHGRTVYGG